MPLFLARVGQMTSSWRALVSVPTLALIVKLLGSRA